MKKQDYNHHIKGYSISHCCIVNSDFFAFIAQEVPDTAIGISDDDYDYATRLISLKNGIVKSATWESGFKYPKLIHTGDNGYLIISWEGRAKETRDTPNKFPQYTLDTPEFQGEFNNTGITINQFMEIDNEIYAIGTHHKLLKRTGKKTWIDLTSEKKHPQLFKLIQSIQNKEYKGDFENSLHLTSSFHSVDGFNNKDIYAVGWGGDIWHYNSEKWQKLDAPSNEDFHRVICGDDGFVYIISTWGTILKLHYDATTHKETWKKISQDVASKDHGFEDATWFNDKLYLSNSWGLFIMENEVVKRVDFTDQGKNAQTSFKNVTSGHGVLVSYGPHNAVLYDGEKWKSIISHTI